MKASLFFVLIFTLLNATPFSHAEGDPAEIMKKWMQYATPGEQHQILKNMAGRWKYTSTWWESADAKPQTSSGTSKMKMILGGRFLLHETKGKMMGQPFEGLGITGYDNLKGKFDTLWLDSMGTGIMHGTGSFDAKSQTLKDEGEFSCPLSEDKKREYRGEWKIIDKNNMTYTMYGPGPDGGKEFKQGEMVFKRK